VKHNKYDVFIHVLEFGSLSRAAVSLNYTQSAISQMIQTLEQEIGLTLLNRSRTGVSLTPDGEQLLPYIKDISHAHLRFMTRLNEIKHIEAGTIRIAAFTSVACHWLPERIYAFKKNHPHIKFELKQGDYFETEKWVLDDVVDIGIVKLPSKLQTTPFHSDRMMAVLPKNHPLANASVINLQDLEQDPFIMLEPGNNDDLIKIFNEQHISPDIGYYVRDDYTIMSLIEKGLGVSVLPELVLNRTPYDIVCKPLSPNTYRTLALAIKNPLKLSIATQAFMDMILNS